MQLHTLAYLDPAAASRQRSMRDPRAAPTVATTVVRHGGGSSLDGSAATGVGGSTRAAAAAPAAAAGRQQQQQQQLQAEGAPHLVVARHPSGYYSHGNTQNLPPGGGMGGGTGRGSETLTLAAGAMTGMAPPPPPPRGATVSRAPVVLPHGGRVTKATGLVLREWGSLYPQAWADTTAPPPPLLEGMVVVERQDPADKRRASASTRVSTHAGLWQQLGLRCVIHRSTASFRVGVVTARDTADDVRSAVLCRAVCRAFVLQPRRPEGHVKGCRCHECLAVTAALAAMAASSRRSGSGSRGNGAGGNGSGSIFLDEEGVEEDDTPGPGQYEVTKVGGVGRSGPAFTMRGRTAPSGAALADAEAAKMPGEWVQGGPL